MFDAITLRREIGRLAREIVRVSSGLGPGLAGDGNLFTFAESCTGGLVACSIAAAPGASKFFPGSVVAYSDRSKIERLSVTPETIERHGAVSGECAAEMAWGALELFDAAMAVSVTGIAGPSGGSLQKPVGTVWLALARGDGRVSLRRGSYGGCGRELVQLRAARSALRLIMTGLDEL
ncbi:MAG: CinA family protein [Synergistaceae bacterium]|jgi:PncC family amidohydrolase|nr:CinA family protein [Synergistaceae bacterium]